LHFTTHAGTHKTLPFPDLLVGFHTHFCLSHFPLDYRFLSGHSLVPAPPPPCPHTLLPYSPTRALDLPATCPGSMHFSSHLTTTPCAHPTTSIIHALPAAPPATRASACHWFLFWVNSRNVWRRNLLRHYLRTGSVSGWSPLDCFSRSAVHPTTRAAHTPLCPHTSQVGGLQHTHTSNCNHHLPYTPFSCSLRCVSHPTCIWKDRGEGGREGGGEVRGRGGPRFQ